VIAIDAATVISDLLERGHTVEFRASGDSMYPVIRAGDVLVVEPLGARSLRRGDVVLADAMRGLTAHRVLDARDGRIITKGDNAVEADAPLDHERILGIVTALQRGEERRRVRNIPPLVLHLVRAARRFRARLLPG
jgi:signal peptidase I